MSKVGGFEKMADGPNQTHENTTHEKIAPERSEILLPPSHALLNFRYPTVSITKSTKHIAHGMGHMTRGTKAQDTSDRTETR